MVGGYRFGLAAAALCLSPPDARNQPAAQPAALLCYRLQMNACVGIGLCGYCTKRFIAQFDTFMGGEIGVGRAANDGRPIVSSAVRPNVTFGLKLDNGPPVGRDRDRVCRTSGMRVAVDIRAKDTIGDRFATIDWSGRGGNVGGRDVDKRIRLGQIASNGGDQLRRLADAVDNANPLAERQLVARRWIFTVGFQIALERVELFAVDFFGLVP